MCVTLLPNSSILARTYGNEHFRLEESGFIMGLTPIGRTTVYVLGMNTDLRIQIPWESLNSIYN